MTTHHIIIKADGTMGPAPEPSMQERQYAESTRVGDIQIHVNYDEGYNSFRIYFPQIDLAEASKRGIYDQVILLGILPEVAKLTFRYAERQAAAQQDVYALYRKVDAFSRSLPQDLDD